MLSVDQALKAVLSRCRPQPARPMPLAEALGRVLDEEVVADIDLPPFDKALMDGYAIRSADLATPGERRLRLSEEIFAGRVSTRFLGEGEAARIMTGAPLPPGADAVVMVERSTLDGGDVLLSGPVAPGQFRLTRGREMRAGEVLLCRGTPIDAARLGLIASSGRAEIRAIPGSVVAVVPTGDELVPLSSVPGPGQIRNSNGPMLAALARSQGASEATEFPIAPDEPEPLRRSLARALASADVVLVSGGVSAGTKDLVPSILLGLGVEPVFHKVAVKPGKPLWFGVGPAREGGPPPLVFGLPGNPASGVVGFLLFVRPALLALAGYPPGPSPTSTLPLGFAFAHRGDRPTYHPSRLSQGRVIPLDWAGSADLRAVALADGFAVFPAGEAQYQAGDPISFLPLR